MDDFLKKVFDRLSVCLTYAGEDIDDFLWVLEQDEKEGRAPADVERMRGLYRQIKEQYAQDSEDLRAGMQAEDALDLAAHMVELYQAMFDYLMAEDPSTLATASAPGELRPKTAPPASTPCTNSSRNQRNFPASGFPRLIW
ncbi:MAG: hypothetical protein IJQ69_07015 [Bacteroidales bacterium]|nr:hypothetical protein [Bacteroidales bacterium]